MGMGSFACNTDAVQYEFVKEICPNEVAAIEEIGGPWKALAQADNFKDNEILVEELDSEEISDEELDRRVKIAAESLKALKTSFNEKTGLLLDLVEYDQDGGDRYDDFSFIHEMEVIFAVGNVWTHTEAGEKYKDKISRCNWVQFG